MLGLGGGEKTLNDEGKSGQAKKIRKAIKIGYKREKKMTILTVWSPVNKQENLKEEGGFGGKLATKNRRLLHLG